MDIQYRTLRTGQLIKPGDQWLAHEGWRATIVHEGSTLKVPKEYKYRRPIRPTCRRLPVKIGTSHIREGEFITITRHQEGLWHVILGNQRGGGYIIGTVRHTPRQSQDDRAALMAFLEQFSPQP